MCEVPLSIGGRYGSDDGFRNFVDRRMVNIESTVAMVIHALRLSKRNVEKFLE